MRVGNLTYTYDNLGNIKTVKEGTELKESYVYDSLNQLVRHNSVTQNKTIVYTYDAGGNILNRKEYAYTTDADLSALTPETTVPYTYGDTTWKDKLTAYDGQSIAYDAIGNPITYRGWSNTWQGRQLSSTSQGGMTLSFKYNVDGIRTQKKVNGTATDFFLNGNKILAQKTGNTVTWFYYDQEGTRVAMEHGGKLYYYLYNLQGDVIALCDASSKQIVAKYSYDAWGKLLTKENLGTGTIADVNPFRYRGYYYDSETGMYYLNARYYDPETGRFLNADGAIGANIGAATMNLFAYCGNSPVILADPTGRYPCSKCHKYTPPSEVHICTVHLPSKTDAVESISPWGKPNSHVDDYSDGYHKERWYGDDGRATKDKHHTDHGNPNQHPNPHEQFWDWTDPEHPKLGPAQPTDATIDLDAVIGVGIVCVTVAGIVWVVVNDATGVGVADDIALVPLLEAFAKGTQMVVGATS